MLTLNKTCKVYQEGNLQQVNPSTGAVYFPSVVSVNAGWVWTARNECIIIYSMSLELKTSARLLTLHFLKILSPCLIITYFLIFHFNIHYPHINACYLTLRSSSLQCDCSPHIQYLPFIHCPHWDFSNHWVLKLICLPSFAHLLCFEKEPWYTDTPVFLCLWTSSQIWLLVQVWTLNSNWGQKVTSFRDLKLDKDIKTVSR